MTSHELARQMLAGPDLPVELVVTGAKDGYSGDLGDVKIKVTAIDTESMAARGFDVEVGRCVRLTSWMTSE